MACLVVFTYQEPQVVAGLPFLANYASSHDAHIVNHDIRFPVAPVAPIVRAAPIVASIPQPISAYSPTAPILRAAPITAAVPQALTAALPSYSFPPALSSVSMAEASPVDSREGVARAPEKIQADKPSTTIESQRQQVPDAALLASQIFIRNIAMQSRSASLTTAQQESRQVTQSEGNQRNNEVLGATPTGFGLFQRGNNRFGQNIQNEQSEANLQSSDQQGDRKSAQSAKLIRQNEDSESIEVNNANIQNYGQENAAAVTPGIPARLATLPGGLNFLPNVYTNVITF